MMFRILILFSFPVAFVAAESTPTAIELMQKMYSSAQSLNYHGTFVYSHGGEMESMRVFHKADETGEYERLFHLNGSPREVIRDRDIVKCILPDSKSVTIMSQSNKHLFLSFPTDLKDLDKYYEFSILGDDRIAGKITRIISVKPKDNFRYGYKIWINKEDSLLLKSELLNEAGVPLEKIMFTQIDVVDDLPVAMLKPVVSGEEYTLYKSADQEDTDTELRIWQIAKMPIGFKPTQYKRRQLASTNNFAEHIVISDGLASVSVYIEELVKDVSKFIGSSYMGAVNVYGKIQHGHQITVVGEVPKATVKMMAESVNTKMELNKK